MRYITDDVRIDRLRPLLPPSILMEELPLSDQASTTVALARQSIARALKGEDDRLVVVVGPCSIHDVAAAHDYARRLKAVASELAADLIVVMRVYFEKPRTTVGWKGLINDPHFDGTFAINEGLRLGRRLLRDLAEFGMPAGCEFLDPISPQFIADLVSWGAIGARTTESQIHRQLGSGLSMPVGFKNRTDGNVQVAVDAVRAAAVSHSFAGVDAAGTPAILYTEGNPDCHVILRGGDDGANHDAASVNDTLAALQKNGLPPFLMVDASHANCGKDCRQMPGVFREIVRQRADGTRGIIGAMLESNLVAGAQSPSDSRESLVYGQSITDQCMDWQTTEALLREAARELIANS